MNQGRLILKLRPWDEAVSLYRESTASSPSGRLVVGHHPE
jgi:hypothetical protein